MKQKESGKIELTPEQEDFIIHGYKEYIPHVNIACTIFGFHNNQLQILLRKWPGLDGWGLPGGFIKHTEKADEAAARILKERTGVENLFLQQFHTFSELDWNKFNRNGFIKDYFNFNGELPEDNWLLGRILTIGYYALTKVPDDISVSSDLSNQGYQWWPLYERPTLLFDYDKIVEKALHTLRLHLNFQPIGFNLLPEKFTMPELQKLYETILGKSLDRPNFKRKMLAQGILERLEERVHVGPHMPPYLYRFDKLKYEQALRDGISSGW